MPRKAHNLIEAVPWYEHADFWYNLVLVLVALAGYLKDNALFTDPRVLGLLGVLVFLGNTILAVSFKQPMSLRLRRTLVPFHAQVRDRSQHAVPAHHTEVQG